MSRSRIEISGHLLEELLARLSRGESVNSALAALGGLAWTTLARHRKADPALDARVEAAIARGRAARRAAASPAPAPKPPTRPAVVHCDVTRPAFREETVEDALLGASERARAILAETPSAKDRRLPTGDAWVAIRTSLHALPDRERRGALVALLLEEADRVSVDRGAAVHRPGAIVVTHRVEGR